MRCKLRYKSFLEFRQYCTLKPRRLFENVDSFTSIQLPNPEYNCNYLCNPQNRDIIFNNIKRRKCLGDIDKVLELVEKPEMKDSLLIELSKIPNCTHPAVLNYGKEPFVLKECKHKPEFEFKPQQFSQLAENLNLIKTKGLGPLIGQRGYILLGDLADLEEALIHYSITKLMKYGFKLVSVPDIIPTDIIKRCGLITSHGRTLVYTLDSCYGEDLSLSGTAEMSLAAQLANVQLSFRDLPLKLAAVSRCFRAEASTLAEERGIYRVHQFTKVEMFICSQQEKSEENFEYIQSIQENIFSSLGLHFQVIDMPPHELGAPAYRKVDIEGWMPGRKQFGELSSCSNCTDYQSRRLNIKYKTENGDLLYAHTLNGTACAIPRMLIALFETNQNKEGCIQIPECLVPYMKGKTIISRQPITKMRFFKYTPRMSK